MKLAMVCSSGGHLLLLHLLMGPAIKNYRQLAQQLQEHGKEGDFQTASEKARIFAQKLNDICLQLVKKK
jgi:hypothetical protein